MQQLTSQAATAGLSENSIPWYCLRDPVSSRFSKTPTSDRQTDRQTDTRPYNITRGKNKIMFKHVLGCVQIVNSANSPGCQAGRWGTVVERLAGRLSSAQI